MLALVALLSFVSFGTLIILLTFRVKTSRLLQLSAKIPGPKPLPIIGIIFDIGWKPEDLLERVCQLINQFPPVMRIWIGPLMFITVTDPKQIEILMSSSEHILKACFYKNLIPWLGTGLLTSSGKKWRAHRKMLTPTFHFKILEQFTGVFNRNGDILLRRLSSHVDGPQFDITSYITMCTLDVVCESAMGVSVKAQTDAGRDYSRSVSRMGYIVTERVLKPWLFNDTVFALSELKSSQNECLKVLHDTTNSVIRKRRQELMAQRATESTERSKEDESVLGSKRHMNFLDLLLQTSQNGDPLTDEEIKEEVDTFMFEGHDTTSSCCLFTLWALAKHQDVQNKAVAELTAIFGDSDRVTTFSDLQDMKYLERVIKESLRLYPSVPIFGRELTEDVTVDGYVFPAGSNTVFFPSVTHRKPQYFPDPEKFDPERFLPENCVGRHPYSYIPFAAGPRNCIGQKFAMLELKSLLSKLLRNYKLCLGDPEEKLELFAELVLKSRNGIRLKISRRE